MGHIILHAKRLVSGVGILTLWVSPAALYAQSKPGKTIQIKTAVVLSGMGGHQAGEGIAIPGLDAMLTERLQHTGRFLVDLMPSGELAQRGKTAEALPGGKTTPASKTPSPGASKAVSEDEDEDKPSGGVMPQLVFDVACVEQQKSSHNFDMGTILKNVDVQGTHLTLSVGVLIHAYDTRLQRVASAWIGYGSATATQWEVDLLRNKSAIPRAPASTEDTPVGSPSGGAETGDDSDGATPSTGQKDKAPPESPAPSRSSNASQTTAQRGPHLQVIKSPSLRLALERAMTNALKKMVDELDKSPWISYVAASKNGKVYLASGKLEGIVVGQTFNIKRPAETLRHPVTGHVIGMDYTDVGRLRIERVTAEYAVGVMESGEAVGGDHVFRDDTP